MSGGFHRLPPKPEPDPCYSATPASEMCPGQAARSTFGKKNILHVTRTLLRFLSYINSVVVCRANIIIIIIIIIPLRVFHTSVSWWFLIGASLLTSPGLFSVFWLILIMPLFGCSPFALFFQVRQSLYQAMFWYWAHILQLIYTSPSCSIIFPSLPVPLPSIWAVPRAPSTTDITITFHNLLVLYQK